MLSTIHREILWEGFAREHLPRNSQVKSECRRSLPEEIGNQRHRTFRLHGPTSSRDSHESSWAAQLPWCSWWWWQPHRDRSIDEWVPSRSLAIQDRYISCYQILLRWRNPLDCVTPQCAKHFPQTKRSTSWSWCGQEKVRPSGWGPSDHAQRIQCFHHQRQGFWLVLAKLPQL